MYKQLLSFAALVALAFSAQAQEGSSLTASTKGSSALSEAVSLETLNLSTTSVEYSTKALESLKINGESSQGSSKASQDSSNQSLGKEQGLAGSVASVGASTVPTVVAVENVTYQTSMDSNGSLNKSMESITFNLSNEQGSVRVSAVKSADGSKTGVSEMWEFSKGGVAASVNGSSDAIKSTGENVSNLSIAVGASGEIILIKAPSESSQKSSQGEIVEGSKVMSVQLSEASTTFSGQLDEAAKKSN